MATPEERLAEIAIKLQRGEQVESITVREFIWWWFAERRSAWTVWRVRSALDEVKLRTLPDFQSTYLDAPMIFALQVNEEHEIGEVDEEQDTETPLPAEDPTYRISKLRAANQKIISINPDSSLEEIVTVMMENDLSQVPVMTNERDVKGIVTWQSIGSRLALNPPVKKARFYMEKAQVVSNSESIFDVIDLVVRYDYVLVRAEDNLITGIITASDLSIQFRQLSEAFLILSEIENMLRILVEYRFNTEDFEACKDPDDSERQIHSAADLNFGEYVRLLENRQRWDKFKLAIDRNKFCDGLSKIRSIRNDVMHFDPDGIPDRDLKKLQDFSRFLKKISAIVT